MAERVDFKELRAQLPFAAVLAFYNVTLKGGGDQLHGFCPLPTHTSKGKGKPRSPSFSANLGKGIFQCFGCGARGNLLDFAILMEGGNPEDPAEVRRVALTLKHALLSNAGTGDYTRETGEKKVASVATEPVEENVETIVNAPLDFVLQNLDYAHPYLRDRGFTDETISTFQLGYCGRGLMKDRIAVPLKNTEGQLIGYAGRIVDDSAVNEDTPRYLFPGDRRKKGTLYSFRKSAFLYNLDRCERPMPAILVVEGFTAVWWMEQQDWSLLPTVAVMGSSCSEEQARLLVEATEKDGTVYVMPDGDKAGPRMAGSLFNLVAPHRAVRWIQLPDDKQPTDLSSDELLKLFA